MKIWKKKSDTFAYKGYRSIIKKTFELPNGVVSDFDIVEGSSYASIVAFTPDKDVLLVRQYRPGPEKIMINLPAGYIDQEEKAEDAAKRELLEETGYEPGNIQFLKKICHPYEHVEQLCFIATDCKKIAEPKLDENEFLEVFSMDLASFRQFIKLSDNEDFDGVAASYLALDRLNLLN